MPPASDKCQILLFFLMAWLTFGVSGCSKEDQNTIEGEVPGPGGAYTAVLFHRNADAVRTETENLSIVRYGDGLMNDIGNIYCASRETTGGKQKLWINWRTSNTLQVFRDPTTRSYKENKHFECLTGIFIQTTPFEIEYGDFRDINPTESSATKTSSTSKASKTQKKTRQK